MFQRAHLITNPKGGVGNNETLLAMTEEAFARAGMKTVSHLTKAKGDAKKWAQHLDLSDHDILCSIGGDGTIHEIINGIMHRQEKPLPKLGLIPGGTGNAFLTDFGLTDPNRAVQRILEGAPNPIDLMQVDHQDGTTFAFNIVAYGLFSSGNELAERIRWLGKRRYDLAGLIKILQRESYEGALFANGHKVFDKSLLFVIANTRHSGEGMLISPNGSIRDGQMNLISIQEANRRQLFQVFQRLSSGTHLSLGVVNEKVASIFEFQGRGSLPLNIDGEQIGHPPFKVKTLPSALEVIL